ncbi:MAG: NUDIX hydrolase [Alphaproteobacteria bacterium]|nr:NUDIX hydrolase [Alphaproteobacteria bacterium]
MSREYPDRPIAAVGVVVLKDDAVLMIQRGKPPRNGQWSIPGGKQKLGETWRATAAREVREETGVEINVIGLVDVVDAIVREGDALQPGVRPVPTEDDDRPILYHYTLVDCAAAWTSGEVRAGSDAAHAEWWPLDRLDELPLWSETVRIITEAAALRDKEQ